MHNGESLNILQDNLDKLQILFPDIFSEGKIDFEKFKANFSDDINFNNERYVLNWAGKADAFKVLQIPTTATLKPQPEESINFDSTQNIFIEGENLEVLKVLQKSYYNKVKCIIIDPPYNTGSDSFIYPDSFKENKADYEKRIGEKDEEGLLMKEGLFRKNSKDSGHYHSNWLSMMYPRLFLAKNLLKDDGVIFVHIDDNEVHNLRLLMNEIFGEENFITQFIWRRRKTQANLAKHVAPVHDYILCYAKYIEKVTFNRIPYSEDFIKKTFSNPDNDVRGVYQTGPLARPESASNPEWELTLPNGRKLTSRWSCSPETYQKYLKENRVVVPREGEGMPRIKIFLSELEGQIPNTWLDNIATNDEASAEIESLFGSITYFSFPKPSKLEKYLSRMVTNKDDDIILDFFAGSASTGQAVIDLNKGDGGSRKFILVQLPEQCDENSEAYKAGYKTIADISKERIRRVITKIEKDKAVKQDMFDNGKLDLGFKSFKLSPSNFKIWRGDEITEDNLVTQLDVFANPVKEESKPENMLYELMLKAGYSLTDKVETLAILWDGGERGGEYILNIIADGELIIVLENINDIIVEEILERKPKKIIALDSLFEGNDQLKTNTVLQMKDAGIDFKTI